MKPVQLLSFMGKLFVLAISPRSVVKENGIIFDDSPKTESGLLSHTVWAKQFIERLVERKTYVLETIEPS